MLREPEWPVPNAVRSAANCRLGSKEAAFTPPCAAVRALPTRSDEAPAPRLGKGTTTPSEALELREPGIFRGVITLVVRHATVCEENLARGISLDTASRLLVPPQIERAVLSLHGKEHHVRIGQMVVYPPSHRLPWSARFVARDEPGDDDAGGRPHEPFRVPPVPDVAGVIPGRLPAVVALVLPLGAVRIHLDGAERGTDRYVSKRRVQGFEQLLAESHSGRDREIGVVRDVRDAVEVRNLAVEHFAHEEML